MRTYLLITNTSDMKYWSYLGTLSNTAGNLHDMVKKHGNIFVNDKGGFFTTNCIKQIHAVLIQRDFPTNDDFC